MRVSQIIEWFRKLVSMPDEEENGQADKEDREKSKKGFKIRDEELKKVRECGQKKRPVGRPRKKV